VIAQSPSVSWPPLFPPRPDEDVLAAARDLVKLLRDAGWTPVARGDAWYAQRFVWSRDNDPRPLPGGALSAADGPGLDRRARTLADGRRHG
jgi:hypothetical protein